MEFLMNYPTGGDQNSTAGPELHHWVLLRPPGATGALERSPLATLDFPGVEQDPKAFPTPPSHGFSPSMVLAPLPDQPRTCLRSWQLLKVLLPSPFPSPLDEEQTGI